MKPTEKESIKYIEDYFTCNQDVSFLDSELADVLSEILTCLLIIDNAKEMQAMDLHYLQTAEFHVVKRYNYIDKHCYIEYSKSNITNSITKGLSYPDEIADKVERYALKLVYKRLNELEKQFKKLKERA